MHQPISKHCVYTIRDGKRLNEIAQLGQKRTFTELKSWVTVHDLWQKAVAADEAMVVLSGDARDCSRLLFWGVLTQIEVQDAATQFTVDRIREIQGRHSPHELILRRTGNNIAPRFNRPYAICRTPEFLEI